MEDRGPLTPSPHLNEPQTAATSEALLDTLTSKSTLTSKTCRLLCVAHTIPSYALFGGVFVRPTPTSPRAAVGALPTSALKPAAAASRVAWQQHRQPHPPHG